MTVNTTNPAKPHVINGHNLFRDTDEDKERSGALDRNGTLTLGVCRTCGAAEIDLDNPCPKPAPEPVLRKLLFVMSYGTLHYEGQITRATDSSVFFLGTPGAKRETRLTRRSGMCVIETDLKPRDVEQLHRRAVAPASAEAAKLVEQANAIKRAANDMILGTLEAKAVSDAV